MYAPLESKSEVMVLTGDCREHLAKIKDNVFDSVVTDPPYHLTNNTGSRSPYPGQYTPIGKPKEPKGGFMGKKWDGGTIAFQPDIWREVLRVLKPGGYLLSFGGTRTYHRMVCAIEDAGFEIRDQIQWLYGSGFPKSHNIGNGHGTALKPAHEPIVLARKFLEGTVIENFTKWGTGVLNIDNCRVGKYKNVPASPSRTKGNALSGSVDGSLRNETGQEGGHNPNIGRWPANIIHDGSEEVLKEFPDSAGQQGNVRGSELSHTGGVNTSCYGEFQRVPFTKRSDIGSAARFFYCAKASKQERRGSKHPTIKPIALMRYLVRLVTPFRGLVLDPFAGTGTTGEAAFLEGFNSVLIESDEGYRVAIDKRLHSLK